MLNLKHKEYIILNSIFLVLIIIDICIINVHLEENTFLTKLVFGEKNGYFNKFDYLKDPGWWGYIIQWFYEITPHIPWFPILMLFLGIISLAFILNILLYAASHGRIERKIYVPLFIFLIVLLNGNIVWIHHTRIAFLMCGGAMLLNLFVQRNRSNIRYPFLWYFFTALWFAGGMFLRPEAAVGTIVIMTPGIFIFFGRDIKVSIKTFGLYIILMAALGGYYLYQVSYNTDFYYKLEPDVEYEMMDRGNIISQSEMKSAKDSVKYESIIHFWSLGDISGTSSEFARSLIEKPNDFKHRLFFFAYPHDNPRKSAWTENFAPFIISDIAILIFCCIIVSLSFARYGFRVGGATAIYVLLSLSFILITFGINRYARVVEPLSGLLCALSLLTFFLSNRPSRLFSVRWIIIPISLFALVYIYLRFSETFQQSQKCTQVELQVESAVDSVMQSSNRKLVYLTPIFSTFNTPAFHPFYEFPGKQLIITEFAQYSGHKPFLERLSEITGCDEEDYLCRFQFLKNREKDLIIISDEERMKFLDKYLLTMYDFDLGFSKLPSSPLYGDVRVWLP